MSYTCERCGEVTEYKDWCLCCNEITEIKHECEIEKGRFKNLEYGEAGWTTTVYYEYCNECGWFNL